MPLSSVAVKNAKAREKPYKIFDEKELFLLIGPAGSKGWRLKYRFAGKEQLISLGVYPDVGLKEARAKREDARKLLAAGVNPSQQKQDAKASQRIVASDSFEAVAREWLSKQHLADVTRNKALWLFEALTFPWIGGKAISEIQPRDMLAVLRRIEARGKLETAQRVSSKPAECFVMPYRQGLLTTTPRRHYAARSRRH